MKLVSVNLAKPRTVSYRGQDVPTGIFKEPVAGAVAIGVAQLEGDLIADPRYHGGPFKAVYGYAAEDYAWWEGELGLKLSWGAFGENLTIAELSTADACVGDVLSVGTARLEAVQPRQPCFKLGLKFGDPKIIKRFLESERWGVYFRVLSPGKVRAGDAARWESRHPARFSLVTLGRLEIGQETDPALVRTALALESLSPETRAALEGKK
jgi:MOSC domain-containing protein YiiM